jgi:hypothetical protein
MVLCVLTKPVGHRLAFYSVSLPLLNKKRHEKGRALIMRNLRLPKMPAKAENDNFGKIDNLGNYGGGGQRW